MPLTRNATVPARPNRGQTKLGPWLLLLVLAACNERALSGAHRGAGDDAGGIPGGLSAEQAARVVARVGDRTITLGDYAATLDRMDTFDRLRYQSAERRKELLDEIIDVELLAQDARTRGLDKQPDTQEALRQILRDALLVEARSGLPPPADIPEEEVRAYYEAHRDDYREPERRRASHIVLKDRDAAVHLSAEAKRATPVQWGELYMKHSTDAPKKASPNQPVEMIGDLGIVGPPGEVRGDNPRFPPEIRAALFALKGIGDVTDKPVQAAGAWHLVRMTGKTDGHERSLLEAERTIRVSILQAKISEREKALEADLRRKFPVTVDDQALTSVEVPNIFEEGADAGAGRAASGDAGHR